MVEAAARAVGLVKTYGSGDTEVRALDGVDVNSLVMSLLRSCDRPGRGSRR